MEVIKEITFFKERKMHFLFVPNLKKKRLKMAKKTKQTPPTRKKTPQINPHNNIIH